MGSYAELTLDSMCLEYSYNSVDPYIIWLYLPSEKCIKQVHRDNHTEPSQSPAEPNPDEFSEDNPLELVQYRCSAAAAYERLELKGFTYNLAELSFKKGLEVKIDQAQYLARQLAVYPQQAAVLEMHEEKTLSVLRNLTVQRWLNTLDRIRAENLTSETLDTLCSNDQDLPLLQYMLDRNQGWFGFPGFGFLPFLRLTIERIPPYEQLVYDLTPVVSSGYIDKDQDHISASEANVSADATLAQKTIVLAEGSSDMRFLRRSLKLLCPNLADYFHFFDFSMSKFPGGVSVVSRLVQAFAATEIQHRIIGLFDNDTVGRSALQSLEHINLPSNIVVRHLPDISLARNYPTLGPTGGVNWDVNGLAGSIEMYFGEDVLKDDQGDLQPVLWKGYNQKSGKYQGEIRDKKMLQDKFEAKLVKCEQHPELIGSYDWEGMKSILDILRTAFHDLDRTNFLHAVEEAV